MHVRLGENEGSRLPELPRDEGVVVGKVVFKREGTAGGHHVRRLHVILEQHGNAVKGSHGALFPEDPVELVRFLQRLWVDQDDGVEGRPFPVVGFNAADILFRDGPAGCLAALHGLMDLPHGRFFHAKTLFGQSFHFLSFRIFR
ncbi:hypothetical protein SDC9_136558 [bioreactor metagenome]|uniref:Uncharacterized protein n=1 Tax=bioreactor metagenome TaxID=1076179 RepID=A0A645DJF8_9ZZZZ